MGNLGPLGPDVPVDDRAFPVLGESVGPTDLGAIHLLSLANFVRDPGHTYAPTSVSMPYDPDTELPDSAVDTGLHQGATSLWLAPDGRAAYAVTPSRVERWPALHAYLEGCA